MRKEIRQIFAAIHVLVAVKELKTRSAPFVNKVIKRNDFDWKLQLCKQQRKKIPNECTVRTLWTLLKCMHANWAYT